MYFILFSLQKNELWRNDLQLRWSEGARAPSRDWTSKRRAANNNSALISFIHIFIFCNRSKNETKKAWSAKALRVPDRPRAELLIGCRFYLWVPRQLGSGSFVRMTDDCPLSGWKSWSCRTSTTKCLGGNWQSEPWNGWVSWWSYILSEPCSRSHKQKMINVLILQARNIYLFTKHSWVDSKTFFLRIQADDFCVAFF